MVPLEELMATRLGSVDPSKFPDETFELYSIPAFDCRRPEVVAAQQIGSTKQIVQPRDVLLSKIVPHIRRSWIVGSAGMHRQIASGEWIVFRSDKVMPEYIRHVFMSDDFHAQFMQTVSGVGGSLLRARPAQVAKIRIPLPPVFEQRRIGAILDQADSLRAKRREALVQLGDLQKAIFIEMFGDPATNPKGWPVEPFGNQFKSVRYGTGSPPPYSETGIPFIRATNIKAGRISAKDLKHISAENAKNLSKCRVKYGNIIVVRSGVNTGDCAVIPIEFDGACAAFDLIVDIEYVDAIFYAFLINSEFGRRILSPLTRRAAQPHLNAEQLQTLPLISPPAKFRKEFSERMEEIERLRVQQLASLSELENLFSSLQQRAFHGAL